jgi:hypothetical protein
MVTSHSDDFHREIVNAMPLETPLDWAKFYVSKGWSVLPIWWIENEHCACGDPECKSQGKHPIGHLAPHGLKSASNDPSVVAQWAQQTPQMNIAIATGAVSNLIVLDLDVKETDDEITDGEYELKNWLASKGINFPDSLVQETGGGGSHILLSFPAISGPRPVIASRANWLPGVDIRADGGYIVAAPSQHISGKFYHWQDGHVLSMVSNDILSILAEKRNPTGSTLGPSSMSTDIQVLMEEGFRFGERDDGFIRLAGILRGRGDSLDTAKSVVKIVWEKTDQSDKDFYKLETAFEKVERGYKMWEAPDELSQAEMQWALRSDARAAITQERSGPLSAPKGQFRPIEPTNMVVSGLKRATESPFISTEATESAYEDEEDTDEPDRDPTDPFDIADLMEGVILERESPTMLERTDGKFLIYPGRFHSIYGEPGHGKTWVALHLVREQLSLGNVVAYLDYDEDDAGKSIALRLRSLGIAPPLVRHGLRYLNPQGMGRNQEQWSKLKQQLKIWKPTLVVVDTMAPALVELGLNEKDNSEVGAWYAHARWLLRGLKPQAALVIIDHVVKSGEGRGRWARGAGDKLGRLHAAYGVESAAPFDRMTPGFIKLTVAKDRAGEIGREGETASIVKFFPSNLGESLKIIIDTPDSTDYSMLVHVNENHHKVIEEKLIIALNRGGVDGFTRKELKAEIRGLSAREIDEGLERCVANGKFVTTVDADGNILRYIYDA